MRSYTINIIPGYAADPTVHISQYDKDYPIYFTIMDGNTEADLTGVTALFSMTKPDGTKAFEECAIADGKVILFVTAQMSAAAGIGSANLTLTKNTRKESTSKFTVEIESAAAPEDYLSGYEMSYYETVLSRIDNAVLTVADAQGYADAAAESANAAAVSAEQASAISMADAIACFPVGTILMTATNTNPGTYIGGTWTAIEGSFLLAQSEDHPAGETGGAETVELTEANLPRHMHYTIRMAQGETSPDYLHTVARSDFTHSQWENARYQLYGVDAEANSGKSSYVGSGTAHDNMPPYLAVYVWKRTA